MVIASIIKNHLSIESILKTGNSTELSSECPRNMIQICKPSVLLQMKADAVPKERTKEVCIVSPSLESAKRDLAMTMNDHAVSARGVARVLLVVRVRGARF